jgi:hypothetical protein
MTGLNSLDDDDAAGMNGVKMFKKRQFSMPLPPICAQGEPKVRAEMVDGPVYTEEYSQRAGRLAYGIPRKRNER